MEIRLYRKKAQLKQGELARRVGVTQPYLCSLENGKKTNPSLALLQRIANVLGVTVSDLLTRKAS